MKYLTGNTKVATAQTAVPLATAANYPSIVACDELLIYADPSNVGALVAVGDSSVNAKATLGTTRGAVTEKKLPPIILHGVDPTALFVDVSTSGDAVTWIAVSRR